MALSSGSGENLLEVSRCCFRFEWARHAPFKSKSELLWLLENLQNSIAILLWFLAQMGASDFARCCITGLMFLNQLFLEVANSVYECKCFVFDVELHSSFSNDEVIVYPSN